MNQPPLNDSRTWCELRAHDRIIRYRCSGAGRSLLVLGSADFSPFWAALVAGLDGRFRVIAPEPPPEETDLAAWLASLLEGLGTSVIRVVAGDRFHTPALEIAHADPDQVAGLVLVAEQTPRVRVTSVPVLVVDGKEPADKLGERIRDFLTRGPAATA